MTSSHFRKKLTWPIITGQHLEMQATESHQTHLVNSQSRFRTFCTSHILTQYLLRRPCREYLAPLARNPASVLSGLLLVSGSLFE